nr:HEAT repeat domain-containing protein [Planctomycetota bacterium]
AEEEIVTARLSWEPGGVGGFSSGKVPWRAGPPEGVTPLTGVSNVRYARIKMAGSKGLALALDIVKDAPRLWVDRDFDGDLQEEKQTYLQRSGTRWFRRQVVLAPYADESQPVPIPLQFNYLPGNGEDYVTVYAPIHRRGTVVLGGRLRLIALTDHSYDVCFDDEKRDRIWVDLDGDGRFQSRGGAPERVAAGEPFRVGEEGWIARVTSPSGLAIEFRRAKTVPPAKPRTWPDVTPPTAGVTRNPPAESLDVLERRFEAEKSKTYTERYATVNLIGNVGTKASFELLLRIAKGDSDINIQNAAWRGMGNKAYLDLAGIRVATHARKATGGAANALAQALHYMGYPDREAIYIDMVNGSDSSAVSGAARWLAYMRTERGRKAILAVVRNTGTDALRYSAYIQGARNLEGGPPIATILAAADDNYPTLKAEAIRDLAKLGHPEARKRALALAETRPVQVTIGMALAEVLGAQGDATAVSALLGFFEDENLHANVRKKVLEQLRYIRAPASVDVIVKALRSKIGALRAVAAEILAAVPERRVTQALLKRAKREKDADVKPLLLEALGDHGDDIALGLLLKTAKSRRKNEARRAAIRALARLGFHRPKVRTYLLGLLEARSWEDRILALDAAKAAGDPGLASKVLLSLTHERWQVRLAAVEALDALRAAQTIEPLIARLEAEEEERVRDAIATTLFRLTGQNLYDDAAIWKRWWAEHGKGFEIPTEIPQPPEQHAGTQAGFYGIPVKSERVIFVIDQSGSMSAAGEPAGDDGKPGRNRLDVAVREVLGAIGKLKNRARVNVIFFHSTIHPWQDKLRKLGTATRRQLRKDLESKKPTGGTNLYDGLERALQSKDVDTIFLLSDGVPGAGKYVATPDILRAVRRENQTRRVAIHCVSIGMDSELLRRLAAENGGRYVRR